MTSPITVAEATGTETTRRIADMSHLSRGEPSPLSPEHIDVRSCSCDDRGECGELKPRGFNGYEIRDRVATDHGPATESIRSEVVTGGDHVLDESRIDERSPASLWFFSD